jgi:hypothetical protein
MTTPTETGNTVTVKRDDGRVWIEGVKGFSPGDYADSVHGCQARILQALGESLSYEDLLCYSGFAFRIGIHEGLCPSAGHPCCGFVCIENGNRALPWKTRSFESMPDGKPPVDRAAFEAEACKAIKESIDRGIPVHYGSEEDGLIIGYAEDGRRWWCIHPYEKWGAEPFWQDEVKGFAGGNWPWGIEVWTEPKNSEELVPARDLTLAALRQAVEMWNTEKRGDYFVGEAAYAHWLKWLRDVDSGKVADAKAGMQGNGWCFDVLIHSRRIAARWLSQTANTFPDASAAQLRIAAEHYAQIPELCMQGLTGSWDLTLGPERSADWTSALRQQQITRLEAAREHDRAAIAAIAKALKP